MVHGGIYPAYVIYFYAKLSVLDERIYSNLLNEVYDVLKLDEEDKRKFMLSRVKSVIGNLLQMVY